MTTIYEFQTTLNVSSYLVEVSSEPQSALVLNESLVDRKNLSVEAGRMLNEFSSKDNISSVQDNGSDSYYDAFQTVRASIQDLDNAAIEALIQNTTNSKTIKAQDDTDNEAGPGQACMPERLNPFILQNISWPKEWLELGVVGREELGDTPFICDIIAKTKVTLCPQWYTDLASVKSYWQSGSFVSEYYECLKGAMNEALDEFNVPAADDHLERYSKLVGNIEESAGIHQSVKDKLAENLRAVELMELLELA